MKWAPSTELKTAWWTINNRDNNSIDVSSGGKEETSTILRPVIDLGSQSFYINELDGRKKNDAIINLTNVTKLKSVVHTFVSVIIEACGRG